MTNSNSDHLDSTPRDLAQSETVFGNHRVAALAILSKAAHDEIELQPKAANFLGSCCAYDTLTPRMVWWLTSLLRDNDLPPLAAGYSASRAA